MAKAASLKARIERLKKQFTGELEEFPSSISDDRSVPSIDDGAYGDPLRDPRPEFVKEESKGWESLVVLKR